MRSTLIKCILLGSLGSPVWGLSAESSRFEPKIVDIFIPAGMTAGETTKIAVEFELETSCDSISRATVFRNEEHRSVFQLVSEAVREEGENCRPIKQQVRKLVSLGQLPTGLYEIRNYHRLNERFGELRVQREATDSPDGEALAFSFRPH